MISIIIPSKDEPYLQHTVEDLKRHAKGDIEVLVGEDTEGIGQRAMMNILAQKAQGKYIMKTDAHCSFAPGFDIEMLRDFEDDMVMAPYLMVLDAENWQVMPHKKSSQFVFDTELVMHYGEEKPGMVNETMCLQGSCFLTTVENYWKWNLCDEALGSWGFQAAELGIKTWTNGGRCVTTKRTYYGHLFRHTDTEFPYKRDHKAIEQTRAIIKKKLLTPRIGWIVEKFGYPRDWSVDKLHLLK